MLQNDDLYQAVKETLFRMHLDYRQPQPTEMVLAATAVSWRDHLQKLGVPWDAVGMLYDNALKTKAASKSRGFMPSIDDILFEWDKAIDAGYWEKQNVAEDLPALPRGAEPVPTANAPNYVKLFMEFQNRSGACVTCDCPGDKFSPRGKLAARLVDDGLFSVWVCAQDRCGFRVKADELLSLCPIPMPAAEASECAPEEPPREYDDVELLELLATRCGFQRGECDDSTGIAFGRHMLKVAQVDLWTVPLARSQWRLWHLSAPVGAAEVVSQ